MTALNCIDFHIAMALSKADLPFSALVGAALARADTDNAAKLREAFPALCAMMQDRYDAPGGILTLDLETATVDAETLHARAVEIAETYLERIR